MKEYGFIRVGAIVNKLELASPIDNAKEIVKMLRKADNEGIAIVTTPELSLTGYTCGDLFLQDELLKLQRKFHKTIVFVTHDMDEAIKLADKIAIMEKGELVQYDTPENILKHPANEFVEDFVGHKRIWNSPEFIKVKDIMITRPITCKEEDSKFYCINKMRMTKVDSLMVVNEAKELLGILYAESLTLKHHKGKKIKDIIERDFVSVKENDSIVDLTKVIKNTKSATIPVVDRKNHLTGLITRSSLITALSQQFVEEDE